MSSKPDKGKATGRLKQGACELIFDADLIPAPTGADWLTGPIRRQASGCEAVAHGGRGRAWFIQLSGLETVLRSYQRGGLVARINRQSYLGLNASKSRAFREWYLLHALFQQGLPVPQPVAASCCRWPLSMSPLYRAHILVARIPGVSTLDQLLQDGELPEARWQQIGRVIRRFHNAGVFHADLNANNILLNAKGEIFLIDFDKSYIRDDGAWKVENLTRLKRSLLKQQSKSAHYYFTEQQWTMLTNGYSGE